MTENNDAGGRSSKTLATRLATAGLTRSLREVTDIAAGLAAAALPADVEDVRWLDLLAPDADAELAGELRTLIDGQAARIATSRPEPALTATRAAALRTELARRDLAGFIVPRGDEHQGEYVAARSQRLAWLTGFTGSAGLAVILSEQAAIFVDGRYTLQVRDQVDTDALTPHHATESPPQDWIAAQLRTGERLGYDPWLHTEGEVQRYRAACDKAGGSLLACEGNPIDAVWSDQPPPPLGPVVAHDQSFAGESATDKRTRMGAELTANNADATVLTMPDSIAWLLNIRGADVPNTPLPLSFAILLADGTVDLFIDQRKLVPGLASHLGNEVAVHAPAELAVALNRLGAAGKRVQIDASTAASWTIGRLSASGANIVRTADPCAIAKARKNTVELEGIRNAHIRDGAALTRFLAWLAREAPGGGLDELSAAAKLAGLRAENDHFRGVSFDTISGAGANGAIVHYMATPATNRQLVPGNLFLVDSGGQYLDGTTDVTRTVAIGSPSAEQSDHFTRVLKGHIALGTCKFPEGTTGSQLDILARMHLWQVGLDYDHGTGHGVGSYLSVHEGPQRISKIPNRVALKPGMIISNEPGYYKTGAYGIRIENLVAVTTALPVEGAEKTFLAFETLTKAPIDLALVEPSLLTNDEIAWLNDYHAGVRNTLSPLLDARTAAWLADATAAITHQ